MREPDNDTASGRAEDGPRVSSIAGHRLCEACGFQLVGAAVHREPRLNLLIVRCPECGHVHPASEPAAATRRRTAMAHFAVVVWLLVKIGAMIGLVGATQLAAGYVARAALSRVEDDTRVSFRAEVQNIYSSTGEDQAAALALLRLPAWARIDDIVSNGYLYYSDWQSVRDAAPWFAPRIDAAVAARGGLLRAVLNLETAAAMMEFIWLVAAGSLLALLFPHLTTRRLLPILGVIAATSLATTAALGATGVWTEGAYELVGIMVENRLGPAVSWCATGAAVAALGVGVMVSRPVARAIVRAGLRPELRAPLEGLWLADGKPLPNDRSWGLPRRPRRTGG